MFATRFVRRLRFAILPAVIAAGALLGPSPAAAYSGNWCHATTAYWQQAVSGAVACVDLVRSTATSRTLRPGAYDSARDGFSAVNYTLVDQLVNGRWLNNSRWLFTNSGGAGTTALGGEVTMLKAYGATQYRVRIQACTYDVPTRQYINCSTMRSWAHYW